MLRTLEISPVVPQRSSIIWLHGLGASGHDFVDIVPQLNLPAELGVRFIFPHAPVRAVKYAGGAKMRAWFDFDSLDYGSKEDANGIREAESFIGQLINKERQRGIPSEKIVLAGFSQGGAMALQCGLRYPETLGGILVLSAWLPLSSTVEAERNVTNQKTPILMLHGTLDPLIPLSWADESCASLQKLGYFSTIRSYPMQHTVCPEEITEIGIWLRGILG